MPVAFLLRWCREILTKQYVSGVVQAFNIITDYSFQPNVGVAHYVWKMVTKLRFLQPIYLYHLSFAVSSIQ